MKKLICSAAILLGMVSCFSSCQPITGSVSGDAVQEMLASPRLAVTPFQPAWLDEEGRNIWPLAEADRVDVCSILRTGAAREVPELAYQTDDENAPLAKNRFYIYASNGQCLAGTVMNDRVVMHDVVLSEAMEKELYRVLKPNLKKLFKGLK